MTLAHNIKFSLEVFPPKTVTGLDNLAETVQAYDRLDPAYITVTFGTGGVDQSVDFARRTIKRVTQSTTAPIAAHLTCAGRSKQEIDSIIDAFREDGVRTILALRGDILGQAGPYEPHPEGHKYTQDFIAHIRKKYSDLKIIVAGYPETHPESPSETFDLDHLKKKVDAGADRIVTQFFFDPEVFLQWRNKVVRHGINVPLTPGLLPILDFKKVVSFAGRCNANVPPFLNKMFDGVDVGTLDHKLLAMNVLSHQITRLIEHGVDTFHFYTLNDTLLTRHLCVWMRAAF